MTTAESLFKDLCAISKWVAVKIPESRRAKQRRADFFVYRWPWHVMVAEIKQFDATSEERSILQRRATGQVVAFGGEPGQRVRSAIADGAGQLRATTRGWLPGLLVVHDNTGLDFHAQPYHVLAAMFGLEVVQIAPPETAGRKWRFLGIKFGPKRKTTPEHNRSVSAVAILYSSDDSAPHLDVFHNPHSVRRLAASRWLSSRVRHFLLGEPDQEGRRGWVKA